MRNQFTSDENRIITRSITTKTSGVDVMGSAGSLAFSTIWRQSKRWRNLKRFTLLCIILVVAVFLSIARHMCKIQQADYLQLDHRKREHEKWDPGWVGAILGPSEPPHSYLNQKYEVWSKVIILAEDPFGVQPSCSFYVSYCDTVAACPTAVNTENCEEDNSGIYGNILQYIVLEV